MLISFHIYIYTGTRRENILQTLPYAWLTTNIFVEKNLAYYQKPVNKISHLNVCISVNIWYFSTGKHDMDWIWDVLHLDIAYVGIITILKFSIYNVLESTWLSYMNSSKFLYIKYLLFQTHRYAQAKGNMIKCISNTVHFMFFPLKNIVYSPRYTRSSAKFCWQVSGSKPKFFQKKLGAMPN